jgi:hypothetical protein
VTNPGKTKMAGQSIDSDQAAFDRVQEFLDVTSSYTVSLTFPYHLFSKDFHLRLKASLNSTRCYGALARKYSDP